jgi:hypothetical protein
MINVSLEGRISKILPFPCHEEVHGYIVIRCWNGSGKIKMLLGHSEDQTTEAYFKFPVEGLKKIYLEYMDAITINNTKQQWLKAMITSSWHPRYWKKTKLLLM